MQASRTLSAWPFGVPAGAWRWAALGFVLLALAAAGLAHCGARSGGLGRLCAAGRHRRGGAACFSMRCGRAQAVSADDARRVAEAAARANVAWAITGADGAVLDCNPVYRRMAGAKDGESAAAAGTGAGGRALRRRALSPDARCRRRPCARGKLSSWCRGWKSSPRCVR